jgi:hypothetical protein
MEHRNTLLYWKSLLQETLLVLFQKYLESTSAEGPILPPDSSSYSMLDCKKCDNGLASLEQPHSVCLKTAIFRTAAVTKTGTLILSSPQWHLLEPNLIVMLKAEG